MLLEEIVSYRIDRYQSGYFWIGGIDLEPLILVGEMNLIVVAV